MRSGAPRSPTSPLPSSHVVAFSINVFQCNLYSAFCQVQDFCWLIFLGNYDLCIFIKHAEALSAHVCHFIGSCFTCKIYRCEILAVWACHHDYARPPFSVKRNQHVCNTANVLSWFHPKQFFQYFTTFHRNIIKGVSSALRSIEDDPKTNVIVIRGSGGKAFCAGGDIKALYSAGMQVRASRAIKSYIQVFNLNSWLGCRQAKSANGFLQVRIPHGSFFGSCVKARSFVDRRYLLSHSCCNSIFDPRQASRWVEVLVSAFMAPSELHLSAQLLRCLKQVISGHLTC